MMNYLKRVILAAVIVLASMPLYGLAYQIAPNPNYGDITVIDYAENSEDFQNFKVIWIGGYGSGGSLINNIGGKINNNQSGDLTLGYLGTLTNNGTISNNGSIFMDSFNANTLTNNGELTNNRSINIWHATLTNNGILNNNYGGNLGSSGNLTNNMELINNGVIGIGATMELGKGTLENNGKLTNNGKLSSSYSFTNSARGTLTNNGELINANSHMGGGSTKNYGTLINNSGSKLTNELNCYLTNSGTMTNYGSLTNHGNFYNDGILTNYGTFTSSVFDMRNSGTMINYGSLTNHGVFSNDGILTNYGTFTSDSFMSFLTNIGTLTANGTLESDLYNAGILSGTGRITGNVTVSSRAIVHPGNSTGTLTINGTFSSSGTLLIDIAGLDAREFSVLNIKGSANFFKGGNIEFDFLNGYKPLKGNFWDFLLADTITGWDLLSFSLVGLDSGFHWKIVDITGGERLLITESPVPLPSAVLLLGAGLGRLAIYRRRKLTAKN